MPKLNPLVDYEELTELTGIPRAHLRMMKTRGSLPDPAHPRVPVWNRTDIERWIFERALQEKPADG